MSYLRGFLGRSSAPQEYDLSIDYEVDSLADAIKSTTMIMNDKYEEADKALAEHKSPFHKFMRSVCLFQRGILGNEPEIIKKALPILSDAEQTMLTCYNLAMKSPTTSHQSSIYPTGTVYTLMQAEVEFMYAVMAIMNASYTDAIKALLKVRRAYAALGQIYKVEQYVLSTKITVDTASDTTSRRSFDNVDEKVDELSAHPMDRFIHTGLCYSYGVLQWALSIVPSPFDKVLAFMSFKGDRKVGHRLLWDASRYPETVHGALAASMILVIYNGLAARCDIRVPDAIPYEKVSNVLVDLQRLYSESHRWAAQRAIMLASYERDLDGAIAVLKPGVQDKNAQKFVIAMCIFEQGTKYLYSHNYEATAASFMDLGKHAEWSPGLFSYMVGIEYVDAYRQAVRDGLDADTLSKYATAGNEALGKVMQNLGKKKILGRQLPIEIYLKGNMLKYTTRSAERNCTLVEAVDVSAAEEMIWLHGGYDQMPVAQLETSLDVIGYHTTSDPEELARRALFRAACLRNLGRVEEAKEELVQHVLVHTSADVKSWGRYARNWILPAAHYDLAVCLWQEAGSEEKDLDKLKECAKNVRIAANWPAHDLQTLYSFKVSAAIDALKKMGVQA